MSQKILLAVYMALGVLAMAGCGGYYQAPRPAATPPPAPVTATPPSAPVLGGEVTVSATYARFQPAELTSAKGQVLRLTVTATDTNHTFTVDELGINIAVGRGQTITKEIKVDKAGAFSFYCSVPGHRQAGMEGKLRVRE